MLIALTLNHLILNYQPHYPTPVTPLNLAEYFLVNSREIAGQAALQPLLDQVN